MPRGQEIRVEPLAAARVPDFFSLHGAAPFEWCHCVAWECPTWDGWGERRAEANRALREQLFAAGRFDGYLLYVDRAVAGWCQCGPRDSWPKLATQFGLEPDPGTWAVTCFCIRPEMRRQGMARRLLQAVLGDLRRRGVARVEGFPRPAGAHEDGDVWTGPFELFAQTGFKVVKGTERRLVVALDLSTRPAGAGVLGRYLDSDGRITQWPQKRSIKDAALAYLAHKVEVGREYSEAEINALLGGWHTFGDPALLRRELCDHGFLIRAKDGTRYSRVPGR